MAANASARTPAMTSAAAALPCATVRCGMIEENSPRNGGNGGNAGKALPSVYFNLGLHPLHSLHLVIVHLHTLSWQSSGVAKT